MGNEELWKQLRAPFDEDEIELLPKPLRPDGERGQKGKCKECGGYHELPAVHLSYVGHAGLTMRLDEVVSPEGWSWEPFALDPAGLPLFSHGGLWIKLTILGTTKPGFGDAGGKTGPNAVKEIIGDALRNAAMRFGIATYLWSKSEKAQGILARHGEVEAPVPEYTPPEPAKASPLDEAKAEAFAAARSLKLTNEEMIAEWQVWDDGGHPKDVTEPAKFLAFAAHLKSSMPAVGDS